MSSYKQAKLIRVSPKAFSNMSIIDYSVFKKAEENKYSHFIKSNIEYDGKAIESLENENIEYLYIKHDDFEKYSQDIKKYLADVMGDENLPATLKSEIMHQLASDTMYDLLAGEVSKEKIEHVDESVSATVEFLLNDPNAIKSMLEVTTHDYYTYTHSVDVSTYALAFGTHLGFNEAQLKILGKGAMLHDLGKKKVPTSIINKNGKLTDEEFTIMKNHPSYGVEILKEMGENDPLLFNIVEQHHEKFTGKGYPRGLKGDEIHPFSQIVGICDIFNALTTKRSYKEPMSSFEAFKIMHNHMKDELNLKILSKFIKFMSSK